MAISGLSVRLIQDFCPPSIHATCFELLFCAKPISWQRYSNYETRSLPSIRSCSKQHWGKIGKHFSRLWDPIINLIEVWGTLEWRHYYRLLTTTNSIWFLVNQTKCFSVHIIISMPAWLFPQQIQNYFYFIKKKKSRVWVFHSGIPVSLLRFSNFSTSCSARRK